ncbi:MAG: hypothetical protein HZA60_04465 [Deltaproteobacteria bacterium]|nr:hypothetical protein [Deltaproteobacteria bacterium]
MNRRSFIETLLSSLSLPAAEQEALRVLACSERTAFPKTLFSRGLLTPEGLRRAYETLLSLPSFRRDAAEVRPVPPDILPLPFLRARMVVPVSLSDGTLVVAMADPLDVDAREAIAKVTGRRVAVQVGTEEEIREAIEKAYGEAPRRWSGWSSRWARKEGNGRKATSGWSG